MRSASPASASSIFKAKRTAKLVTLLVEKIQLQTPGPGGAEILQRAFQRKVRSSRWQTPHGMRRISASSPPLDPLFRVGEIDLAYDPDPDLAWCLVCREILLREDNLPEEAGVVRFWCTRCPAASSGSCGALELAGTGIENLPLPAASRWIRTVTSARRRTATSKK